MDYFELNELREISKELDIKFSLHTPYYMDLVSNNEITERSIDNIKWSGLVGRELGASVIVTHMVSTVPFRKRRHSSM